MVDLAKTRVGEGGEGALLSSFSAPEIKESSFECSSTVDSRFRDV